MPAVQKFSSVADWFAQQSAENHGIFSAVRSIILDTLPPPPLATESLKFHTPFYTYCGLLCYLHVDRGRPVLAFCQGNRLTDPQNLLTGGQKYVRWLRLNPTPPPDLIRSFLHEALVLNEMARPFPVSKAPEPTDKPQNTKR
jgi:hypothetical protein